MVVVRFLTPSLQAGDSGSYLASLAAQLSQELGTTYHAVLQQLEDLRLAEWADQAPPPPSPPGHRASHSTTSSPHTYANYPAAPEEHQPRQYSDTDPIYQPGQYAVSSSSLLLGVRGWAAWCSAHLPPSTVHTNCRAVARGHPALFKPRTELAAHQRPLLSYLLSGPH